jgi:hypothetical protein
VQRGEGQVVAAAEVEPLPRIHVLADGRRQIGDGLRAASRRASGP